MMQSMETYLEKCVKCLKEHNIGIIGALKEL